MSDRDIVFVVDDDAHVLKAMARLLSVSGYEPRTFISPRAFLEEYDPGTPGCIVLDVSMPGLTGLELQHALARDDGIRPVVFISGLGDVPTSVEAIKGGAVDFLTKPVDDVKLLAAIEAALGKDREDRDTRAELRSIEDRIATLTHRECEVMEHVVAGRLNKQIAADLGTAEKTVKVHRARVMEKMCVGSVAELARLIERVYAARPR